jgi:predicted dehydrogenase
MKKLRVGVIGAGFWARCQLAGWREAGGAEIVGICNRTRDKAEKLAREFGIPAVYAAPDELMRGARPDVLDIISAPGVHEEHVLAGAANGVPVICQKPMALSLDSAERMVKACSARHVPFFVHENWRWQTPIRALKSVLEEGRIGTPFRGRINMISGYPVFRNQPFFKSLQRFLLTDQGSHQLDVARFLFGEARSVYCLAGRVHPDIRGEDVATVMLNMGGGTTVVVAMGFAENYLEHDHHPQTYIFVEGDKGSAELGPDYWVRVTTADGTNARRHAPPRFPWVDPEYEVAQASIVPCIANIAGALRGEGSAETTGEDNLKTVRLVSAAYDSAATGEAVRV